MDIEKYRKGLLTYLKNRGDWIETDEMLVDELIFNIQLGEKAKQDILDEGYKVNVVRDPKKEPYYQVNTAVTVFQVAEKHINTLYSKLSLSPQDRAKLKLEARDEKDELDILLDE